MPIGSWGAGAVPNPPLVPTAAGAGEHFAALRAAHQRFDAFNEFIAGVDVDAGIAIGDAGAFGHESAGTYGIVPVASRRGACDPDHVATGPKFNQREPARARTSFEPVCSVL